MALGQAQTTGTHLFQCIVQGEPLPTVRWIKDGEDIKDDPRFLFDYSEDGVVSMVIRDVTPTDSGHYQCIAENSEGFAVSSSHLVVKGLKDRPPTAPHVSMQLMEVDETDGFHEIITPCHDLGSMITPSQALASEGEALNSNDQITKENTHDCSSATPRTPSITEKVPDLKDQVTKENTHDCSSVTPRTPTATEKVPDLKDQVTKENTNENSFVISQTTYITEDVPDLKDGVTEENTYDGSSVIPQMPYIIEDITDLKDQATVESADYAIGPACLYLPPRPNSHELHGSETEALPKTACITEEEEAVDSKDQLAVECTYDVKHSVCLSSPSRPISLQPYGSETETLPKTTCITEEAVYSKDQFTEEYTDDTKHHVSLSSPPIPNSPQPYGSEPETPPQTACNTEEETYSHRQLTAQYSDDTYHPVSLSSPPMPNSPQPYGLETLPKTTCNTEGEGDFKDQLTEVYTDKSTHAVSPHPDNLVTETPPKTPIEQDLAADSNDRETEENHSQTDEHADVLSPDRPKSPQSFSSNEGAGPLSPCPLQTSISEEFSSLQNDSGFFENSMMSLNDSSVGTPSRASHLYPRPPPEKERLCLSQNHRESQAATETPDPENTHSDSKSLQREGAHAQNYAQSDSKLESPKLNDDPFGSSVDVNQNSENNYLAPRRLEFDEYHEDLGASPYDTFSGLDPPSDRTSQPKDLSCDGTVEEKNREGDQKQDSVQESSTTWVDHVESRADSPPDESVQEYETDEASDIDPTNRYQLFRSEATAVFSSSSVDPQASTDVNIGSQNQCPIPPSTRSGNVQTEESFSRTRTSPLLSHPQNTVNHHPGSLEPEGRNADQNSNSGIHHSSEDPKHGHQGHECPQPDIETCDQSSTVTNEEDTCHTPKETPNPTMDNHQHPVFTPQEISHPVPSGHLVSVPFSQILQHLSNLDPSTVEVLESTDDEELTRNTYTILGADLNEQARSQEDDGAFVISDVIRTALEDGSIQLSFTATMQIPQFIQLPSDITVATSDTIVLTCVVRGYPEPNVTWVKGKEGPEVKASNRVTHTREGEVHRLEIRSAGPSDSGQYICTASNSEGQVIATVTVTVEDFGSSVDESPPSSSTDPSECSPNQHLTKRKTTFTEHISQTRLTQSEANKDSPTEEPNDQPEDDQGAVGGQLLPSDGHSMSSVPQDSRRLRYAKLVGMAAAFSLAALGVNKVFEMLRK